MSNLPPYVVIKKRKHYSTYYFQVPLHLRPTGWLPAINLGHDNNTSLPAIFSKAWDLKSKLDDQRNAEKLGISTQRHQKGSLPDLVDIYRKSDHYKILKKPTQKGYDDNIKILLKWSEEKKHPQVKAIEPKHIYAFLSRYSDRPRTQKYLRVTLGVLLNQAVLHGYVPYNVVYKFDMPKQHTQKKEWKLWEAEHIQKFITTADYMGYPNVGTAVLLAFETGQRQTDIFSFTDRIHYKNGRLSFIQSKTGQAINIPATDKLKMRLSDKPKEQLLLTVNDKTKLKWNSETFNKAFRKIAKQAGMENFVFRKIRNSLTIHGERAGMTDDEFHSIFGWSRNTVKDMKDNHYSAADQTVANRAVTKLETYRSEK